MKINSFLKRLKLALIHVTHGVIPCFCKKAVHSIDDGDPTTKQTRILLRVGEGYFNHLLLNVFLAINHLKGGKTK
jgi:hypothetical protein